MPIVESEMISPTWLMLLSKLSLKPDMIPEPNGSGTYSIKSTNKKSSRNS